MKEWVTVLRAADAAARWHVHQRRMGSAARHRRKTRKMRFPIALALIVILGSPGLVASQDDPHLGELEYEISCLGCHGLEGRGDGSRTKALKTAPADLTQIKRQNNGTFPLEAVIALIDGRSLDAAHAERDMPVWGKRYRAGAATTESADWIDRRIRAQIAALASYIESLQED